MIVCLCKGVSCSAIRRAIADGASSVEEVGMACGAGTDCGGCQGAIEDILEEERPGVAACGARHLPVVPSRAA